MRIEKKSISKLKPNPSNPRVSLTEKDPEFQQIKKSINSFGLVEPLVWNEKSDFLISGHQRLSVLRAEGKKTVEVVVVNLDERQERELMVALNRVNGKWDYEQLAILLDELTTMPDFDSESIGFTMPELSSILDNYLGQSDDRFNFKAAVESIGTPITRKDDIIELGPHRVLCGDSGDAKDLSKLMGDEKALALFTDPPYLAKYVPGNRPTKKRKKRVTDKMIQNDAMSQEDYEKWLNTVFSNIKPFLQSGSPISIIVKLK